MPLSKTIVSFTSLCTILLFSNLVHAEKTIKPLTPKSIHKVAPPAMVKRCNNLTLTDPMADYAVATYDPSTGKTPLYANRNGFYCKKIKKYTKPFCRKNYKLARNRCVKSLGTIQLK